MPKESYRAKVLKRFQEVYIERKHMRLERLLHQHAGLHVDQASTTIDDIVRDMIVWLESTRYLEGRVHEQREPRKRLDYILYEFNAAKFRKHFRLSRPAFFSLVELVRGHDFEEFRSVQGKRAKADIAQHLLILLRYMGICGNACTLGDLGEFFWIGQGTAKDYIDRSIDAIMRLKQTVITWPNAAERRAMAAQIGLRSPFKNCIGYLDGTIFPLECKPQVHAAEDYFSRKGCYGLNAQLICDDDCRIRYIYCGWPASVHDNRAWQHCAVYKSQCLHFSSKEYILVDSAYKPGEHVIPAYKKGRGMPLALDKEYFNKALAKLRIKTEHCIGRLKGRFQFLKRIRSVLKCKETKKRVLSIIDVACILHNLSLDDMVPFEWIDLSEDDEGEDADVDDDTDGNEDESRREQLLVCVLEGAPF